MNFSDVILMILVISLVIMLIAYFCLDYIPGIRFSILGVHGYKIIFKYVNMGKYGFHNLKQNEDVKYYVNLISRHIMAHGLVSFYHTKPSVQRLVDDYYSNLILAYGIYKDFRKGKCNQEECKEHLALVESYNDKIIRKLDRLNNETVSLINFVDDCREEGYYGFKYDLSHIDDYLEDE